MNNVDEWTTKYQLKEKFRLIFSQLLSDINGESQTQDNGPEPIPYEIRCRFGLHGNLYLRSIVELNRTRKVAKKLFTNDQGVILYMSLWVHILIHIVVYLDNLDITSFLYRIKMKIRLH